MGIRRTVVALAVTTFLTGQVALAETQNAEPLVTQGIGASNCAKLAADLKPAEGLSNPVNLMLYSWAQGYVSAANVSLLEANGRHVDINALDEGKLLTAGGACVQSTLQSRSMVQRWPQCCCQSPERRLSSLPARRSDCGGS